MKRLWFLIEQFFWVLTSFLVEVWFLVFRCPSLLPSMFRLWEQSLKSSPYALSLRAQRLSTESEVVTSEWTYGEVWLSSAAKGLSWIPTETEDRLLDLGCGRGKIVLLGASLGIPSHGMDLLQPLVDKGALAAGDYLPQATFEQGDFLKAELEGFTIFWLTGTCLQHSTCEALAQRLVELPHSFWLLSVTRPLLHEEFPVIREEKIWTSWGRDRLFLQRFEKKPATE